MSQPTTRKTQAGLESFFKPAQPASSRTSSSTSKTQPVKTTFKAPPAHFPHPAFTDSSKTSREAKLVDSTIARPSTPLSQQNDTSSLSPPPSSPINPYEVPVLPPKPAVPSSTATRVIKSSDDEDEDSDTSLEDLATLLQSNRSANCQSDGSSEGKPSTPTASRTKKLAFHISPMPILNKNKFDLKSLASHAEMDRKADASSKRVKAMQEVSERKESVPPQGDSASERLKHSSLLQDVIAAQADADHNRVARAVMRTEATLSDQRWYFFETQPSPSKPQKKAFPTKSIPKEWQSDLKDAQVRHQTFVSGFAEDMVSFGQALPDEIFLWILDEMCVESSEPLRASYCNLIEQSSEQVRRLVVPDVIRNLFEAVGATSASTATTDKIRPVQALSQPYAKRDWSKVRSLIRLLGRVSKLLEARTYAITLLLRMCCDKMVVENVDIFDLVQESINRLCRYVPDDAWESSVSSIALRPTNLADVSKCQTICTTLFNSVEQPTLRLQMVHCTPSVSPRSHDLKRRMAMSFFFKDLSYATTHSHLVMDLGKFIDRLEDHDFDTDSQTDYRELAALIQLLNLALDDARSPALDLKDADTASQHDASIDELAGIIKGIMNCIGNPGAAFISRIEAKEVLELVSQRISDALRSKPKAKITVFDRKKHGERLKEDLDKEKKMMASFFKVKTVGDDADS